MQQSYGIARKIHLLFIGSVLPDTNEFITTAFSRAGNLFQSNCLSALKKAGIHPDKIISIRSVRSYPNSNNIMIRRSRAKLESGMEIELLPFINITPIKQLLIGFLCFCKILSWGWSNRLIKGKIVYTYNLSVPPGLFTLMAARIIGAKAVVSLNDILVPEQTVPNSLFYNIDYYLHKFLIPRFDGHIVVSHEIMTDFCPNCPNRNYLHVEGGINQIENTECKAKQDISQNNEEFHIVYAGTLDEINGIKVLLKAMSLIKDDGYRLSIAGTGPLAEHVIEASKHDSRIVYLGLLSISEVLLLYKRADVLVNIRLTKLINSKYFYPSKMMEYLASGTPVVTTCTGHTKDEFGAFVYLLDDETPEGLARLLSFVSSQDPAIREQLGDSAKKYMLTHKTWDVQGVRIARYLESLF